MTRNIYSVVIMCLLCNSCYLVRSTYPLKESKAREVFPELFTPDLNYTAIVERFGIGDNSVSPRVHSWLINRIDHGYVADGVRGLKTSVKHLDRKFTYECLETYPLIDENYLQLPKERRVYGPKYELIVKLDVQNNVENWSLLCLR